MAHYQGPHHSYRPKPPELDYRTLSVVEAEKYLTKARKELFALIEETRNVARASRTAGAVSATSATGATTLVEDMAWTESVYEAARKFSFWTDAVGYARRYGPEYLEKQRRSRKKTSR